MQLISYLSHQQ